LHRERERYVKSRPLRNGKTDGRTDGSNEPTREKETMEKMKATGWKKMQSTPRIAQEAPLNLHFIITAHHDVTKLAEDQQFWGGNKINTDGTH